MIDVSNPGRAAAVPARRRVTIASWMYLVAIVALDLAVVRARSTCSRRGGLPASRRSQSPWSWAFFS